MKSTTKLVGLHLLFGALAAAFASLATSTGGDVDQRDLIAAGAAAFAYLTGAIMRSPLDAREPDAKTRATD